MSIVIFSVSAVIFFWFNIFWSYLPYYTIKVAVDLLHFCEFLYIMPQYYSFLQSFWTEVLGSISITGMNMPSPLHSKKYVSILVCLNKNSLCELDAVKCPQGGSFAWIVFVIQCDLDDKCQYQRSYEFSVVSLLSFLMESCFRLFELLIKFNFIRYFHGNWILL